MFFDKKRVKCCKSKALQVMNKHRNFFYFFIWKQKKEKLDYVDFYRDVRKQTKGRSDRYTSIRNSIIEKLSSKITNIEGVESARWW